MFILALTKIFPKKSLFFYVAVAWNSCWAINLEALVFGILNLGKVIDTLGNGLGINQTAFNLVYDDA